MAVASSHPCRAIAEDGPRPWIDDAAARTASVKYPCESGKSYAMTRSTATIRLKRVYEAPDEADGTRILVERLWPRGLTKERAAIDLWTKEVAPSTELRRWYGHDPDKWEEFRRRYRADLDAMGELLDEIKRRLKEGPVTFVYAAKDEEHNSAVVLKEFLERRPRT